MWVKGYQDVVSSEGTQFNFGLGVDLPAYHQGGVTPGSPKGCQGKLGSGWERGWGWALWNKEVIPEGP